MEPEWTKKIPSWAVCDWFWLFFVINAFTFVMVLLSFLYIAFARSGVLKAIRLPGVFMTFTSMLISGTSALFFYLVCDRSLKPSS